MRIVRSILAATLSFAMLVSLAPRVRGACPAMSSSAKSHACCRKHAPAKTQPTDPQKPDQKRHDGGNCLMQCCQAITAAPVTLPPLLVGKLLPTTHAAVRPVTLDTLTDPQAVFHPPRA